MNSKHMGTYQDPSTSIPDRVEHLLSLMRLEEKIGQMTLVNKNSIDPEGVKRYCLGAVFSGAGGTPDKNSPAGWLEMVNGYKEAAESLFPFGFGLS